MYKSPAVTHLIVANSGKQITAVGIHQVEQQLADARAVALLEHRARNRWSREASIL